MPSIGNLLEKGSLQIVKSHLRKIVEIYDQDWIVAHELIQNAIDAVQANPNIERGTVVVTFDLDEDAVEVYDNGTGFKHDLNLLMPGGTGEEKRLKSRSPTKGYQGVGLKAVMYSTDRFEIESQLPEEHWVFKTENLREYLDPEREVDPNYEDEVSEQESEETFTRVSAKFSQYTLSEFFTGLNRFLGSDTVSWQGLYAQEEENNGVPYLLYVNHVLNWYFRTQSYVGCVNGLLNISVVSPETEEEEPMKPVEIKMIIRSSSGFDSVSGELGSWLQQIGETEFEITMPYKGWDFSEIITDYGKLRARYQIAPELVQIKPNDANWEPLSSTFKDKFLDLKLKPNEHETEFRKIYADYISILEKPRSSASAEDFEDLFPQITGIYLAIGRTAHFEMLGMPNHGLRYISSNGTPTDHEISFKSTSSTWYLETIHFVVNVDATLNIGKRHLVNNRLVGRIRDFFAACYPKLVTISKLFVMRDPRGGGEEVELPDVVDLNKLNRQGIAIKRFPDDENTLVGLFTATISFLDPDFSIFGLFANATYDGKFTWSTEEPRSERDVKVLEFKLNLNRLIDEFEQAQHDKEFLEVGLAIVWDRRVTKPGWNVKGISHPRRAALEKQGVSTDIVTHVLEDRQGNYCALISVADLLTQIPLIDDSTDDLEEFVVSMG